MIKYICLPSGGFNLIKYLGIIKPFIDRKLIQFETIKGFYGISSGGILSTALCLGLDFNEIVTYFVERPWNKTYNIDKINIMNYFSDKGIFNKKHVSMLIEPLFKAKKFNLNTLTMKEFYDKTKYKLSLFAINASTYELTEFNYQKTPDILLIDALYFSSCIPLIFKPYEYEGVCYLDGGMHTNCPFDICLNNEDVERDEVFGMDTTGIDVLSIPINHDEQYFIFVMKMLFKMHTQGINRVKNHTCKYFIEMKMINYSIMPLTEIIKSKEMRKRIYLNGISDAEDYLNTLNELSDNSEKEKENASENDYDDCIKECV